MFMMVRKFLIPFILGALIMAALSILFWSLNQIPLLSVIMSTITPLSSFGVAVVGITQFGDDGLVREDPFHMMNILLSFALFAFTAAEGAALVISQLSVSPSFYVSTGILLIIGMVCWLIGVFSYLGSLNQIMKFTKTKMILWLIFAIALFSIIVPLLVSTSVAGNRLTFEFVTYVPLAIGLAMIALSLGILLLTYRTGTLAIPIGLSFLGCVFLLTRVAGWIYFSIPHLDALNLLLAIESYIFLGASIISSRQIQFSL